MEKVIILLQLCLPNEGITECVFSQEEVKSQQVCERRVEQLEYEFSDIAEFLNIQCKEVKV
jgi:hypothetical protein|tara:strand:+ start:214 stop:396 length:183 start_codon:yes stop_codon:yes gene_type:complete